MSKPADGDDMTWEPSWESHGIRLESAYNTGTCAEQHAERMARLEADIEALREEFATMAERVERINRIIKQWSAED